MSLRRIGYRLTEEAAKAVQYTGLGLLAATGLASAAKNEVEKLNFFEKFVARLTHGFQDPMTQIALTVNDSISNGDIRSGYIVGGALAASGLIASQVYRMSITRAKEPPASTPDLTDERNLNAGDRAIGKIVRFGREPKSHGIDPLGKVVQYGKAPEKREYEGDGVLARFVRFGQVSEKDEREHEEYVKLRRAA